MRAELRRIALLGLIACSGAAPEAADPSAGAPNPAAAPGAAPAATETHPPIPADNPAWAHDAGGFVRSADWYGESSWHDVRMRLVGHIGTVGRDRARLAAQAGDLAGAAAAYGALATAIEALPTPPPGPALEIRQLWLQAARRDEALAGALAGGQPPPAPPPVDGLSPSLAAARAEVLALAVGPPDPERARAVRAALEPAFALDPALDLDAFTDFEGRHRLRIALVRAALDAADPLGIAEPWGYWEAAERRRQALLLHAAAGALGGLPEAATDADRLREHLVGEPPALEGRPRWTWPSALAEAWAHAPRPFTAEGLGGLPTGDALIDVAAQPGPRAIGRLAKLGLDDPAHRARLDAEAAALTAALTANPGDALIRLRAFAEELDAHPHGSRYYNVKQARNEGVRRLAEAGHAALAAELLRDAWPLHHQDWACPNREGILQAIEGRLLAEAQAPGADAALGRAWDSAMAFLAEVARAEREAPRGPGRPPGPPGAPPPGPPPPGPPPGAGRPPVTGPGAGAAHSPHSSAPGAPGGR